MEACAAIATERGTTRTLSPDVGGPTDGVREAMGLDSDAPSREGGAVENEGFNLHASVRIAAEDDAGRERLCRYGARPPFSLERLRALPGGRIAYRIKKLGAGRAKHRVMTPIELLARLAALVPPPRYPLVRYHGVLAAHAAWRREVVPRPPIATGTAGAEGKKRPCGRRLVGMPRLRMAESRADPLGMRAATANRVEGLRSREGRMLCSVQPPSTIEHASRATVMDATRSRT